MLTPRRKYRGFYRNKKKGSIRADVLVRQRAPGTWECAEIKVRHVFKGTGELALADARQVDEMLRARERDAHHNYQPVQVRPWIFTSFGRPGAEMCADLRRLARLRLRRPDVARAVSVQSVQQLLLRRWRAEISCALVLGDTAVYLTAMEGRGRDQSARGLQPAELHLYDLQDMRVSC